MRTVVLDGEVSNITLDGELSIDTFSGEVGIITRVREPLPAYTGETTVTPSDEQQILHTENLSVMSDIVINPIPNNYGLITWDGSTLTVS